ncbi:MAG TPA: RDD family protein, partial [Caldimonas sp.]|nr:RDD family protein [Caldimonas sp.]
MAEASVLGDGEREGPRVRQLITPEGVDLRLVLADASERATAFLLDVVIMFASLIAVTLVTIGAAILLKFSPGEYLVVVWLLFFFFLRNFYFMAFELTPRAATPGKRIVGLRVATRNGGRLTAEAIFARNALRELEVFLPLSFLAARAQQVDAWVAALALVWCGIFVFFPLFNKDRLRVGDLAAGTWVVRAPKRILEADIAVAATGRIAFPPGAFDAYGIKELSVLEDVLRRKHGPTMADVARRIRNRIGMKDDTTPDEEFLLAYYKGLR